MTRPAPRLALVGDDHLDLRPRRPLDDLRDGAPADRRRVRARGDRRAVGLEQREQSLVAEGRHLHGLAQRRSPLRSGSVAGTRCR